MAVHAYHPGTGGDVVVEESQLDHMRASGWMLMSEHEENEADRQAADDKARAKTAKSTDEGKQ